MSDHAHEDLLLQSEAPHRNGDERRRNWTVSLSGVLLVVSFLILCLNITYAFWADQQRRQERIEFVNTILLANCQQDRAQDRTLHTLVEAVLLRPLDSDATPDQKRVRAVFEAQHEALTRRVNRGCPHNILSN